VSKDQPPPTSSRWLFSPHLDLLTFGGSAALSLLLLALAPLVTSAAAPGATPGWTWLAAVLLVDVAHVWSTAFIVYLDPAELRRRLALYLAVPLACYLAGVALYALGEATFWRAVAYLAVFHFIRQQYGWVRLYRARAGERDRLGALLDGATIYLATLYPLLHWHAHLPREFAWMRDGDFAPGVPPALATAAGLALATLLLVYLLRAALAARRAPPNWGKHLVVATTTACWYLGIVATDSDYAFTVTNVFIHGIPYLVLVHLYARRVAASSSPPRADLGALLSRAAVPFLATLWAIAYLEELLWDRAVWQDHPWLFGEPGSLSSTLSHHHAWLVPLLAVPQLTHYVLDGFLWRRGSNPNLGRVL
jgi:hypothetical protein